ncbi:hypothetical protein [Actinomadura hibisca]|uniref:hypothetical protein n=1 Tax=Actinomadura hibisca TaxID=68565 RepID=UPI00082C694B|nr:hypothetical protein [Actinomadura hibisca]
MSNDTITPERLTGAWTLHRVLLRRGGKGRPMPASAWKGLLFYSADRHFSVTLSVSLGPLRKTIAYAGTFAVDATRPGSPAQMLHQPAMATLPLRPGRTQRRAARLQQDPDVLTLTAAWRGWSMDLVWTRPD